MAVATPTVGDAGLLADLLRESVEVDFYGDRAILLAPRLRDTVGLSRRLADVLSRSVVPKGAPEGTEPELGAEAQAVEYMDLAATAIVACRTEISGHRLTAATAGNVVVHELGQPGRSLSNLGGTVTGAAMRLCGMPELREAEPGEERAEGEETAAPETANRPS